MGSRIPDRSVNGSGGIRTHTHEALVPKTSVAAITPHSQKGASYEASQLITLSLCR